MNRVLLGLLLTLTGCNRTIIDTDYMYNKATIVMPDGSVEDVDVKSWYDYDDSDNVSIVATDGRKFYTHTSNVMLYKDN